LISTLFAGNPAIFCHPGISFAKINCSPLRTVFWEEILAIQFINVSLLTLFARMSAVPHHVTRIVVALANFSPPRAVFIFILTINICYKYLPN